MHFEQVNAYSFKKVNEDIFQTINEESLNIKFQ